MTKQGNTGRIRVRYLIIPLLLSLVATRQSLGAETWRKNDPSKNSVGMNVWFLNDYDGSLAFVDAMKHARPWQDGADWHNPVKGIDERGWPTGDASTVIITGTPEQINGVYSLSFNGMADVSLLWARGTVSNKYYDVETNTTTAKVTYSITAPGNAGLVFRNTRRTPQSAIDSGFTNVRLIRPGYKEDGSEVFTRPFLRALEKFNVIRMMDWSYTNQNLTTKWSERMTPLGTARPGPAYVGPGGQEWKESELGVAFEHQIQLCNALKADMWVNIPVAADDAYIKKMALALRYGTDGSEPYTSRQERPTFPPLDPDLNIYIEYANEIWNSAGGFYCFHVVNEIVRSLPDEHPIMEPAEENVWYLVWRYPAFRIAFVSDTFRSVFGDEAMMSRVRPVLMTQRGDTQATLSQALTWLDAYGRRQSPKREVRSYLYGAGGSAYYGVNKEPRNQSDADAFFAKGNYPATESVEGMGIDAVWAMNYGLKRIAYEGGLGLDGFSEANANRINLDSRMCDMLVKTHDAWSAQGGDLLVYYTIRGPHQWEFTPDIAVTATPKLLGIDQLRSKSRASVTLGPRLPGKIVAVEQPTYRIRTGYEFAQKLDGLDCVGGNDSGEWIALPAHADSAFSGKLVIEGAAPVPTKVAVWINGSRKGLIELNAGEKIVKSASLKVEIPAGLVVVRLEVLNGGFSLRSITAY